MDPYYCKAGAKDVIVKTFHLTNETPLVGFHGMVDKFGIVSLGPILLDTIDPICQKPYKKVDMRMYKGMDDYQKSNAAEAAITEDERVRAQALEAIIMYDSMVEAQKTKAQIMQQIKDMHEWQPIKIHGKDGQLPASMTELREVLDRLAKIDIEDKPMTKEELKDIFDKLADFFYDSESKLNVDVTIGEVKTIFDRLAMTDGMPNMNFSGRGPMEQITAADMTLLLETLAEHYATGSGKLNQAELDQYASEALIKLFDKLDDYYTFGEGSEQKEAKDIWMLFDYLAEFFG